MQLSPKESITLAKKFKARAEKGSQIIICPDFLSLPLISPLLKRTAISLGAQDCANKERGALTGEISPADLKTLGVKYVIIGHSERREKLGENDQLINSKIIAALKNGLVPIICVGEKLTDKEAGRTRQVLNSQLRYALRGVKIKKASDLIIAYEPLWAIGTGQAIIPAEAELIASFLEKETKKILGKKIAVLYGGSVDLQNAPIFLEQNHVAGLLVGGASNRNDFYKIWSSR